MDYVAVWGLNYLQTFRSDRRPDKNHFLENFNMREQTYDEMMETLFKNGLIDENGNLILTYQEWIEDS